MAGSLRQRRDAQKIRDITNLLTKHSKTILRRQELSKQEVARVKHSFDVLQFRATDSSASKTTTRQKHYYAFLKRVQELCGDQMVVLCAVALGQSIVGDFSTAVRLELPAKMKEKSSTLNCPLLNNFAEEYRQASKF